METTDDSSTPLHEAGQVQDRFLTFQQAYRSYQSQLAAFFQQQTELEEQRGSLQAQRQYLRDQREDLERVKRERASVQANRHCQTPRTATNQAGKLSRLRSHPKVRSCAASNATSQSKESS